MRSPIVFVTDEQSRKYLDEAVASLRADGAEEFVVLPYFLSANHPAWSMARSWLAEDACLHPTSCSYSTPFGRSYFAVDLLDTALSTVEAPAQKRLVIVGSGAQDEGSAQRMHMDWQHIADSTNTASTFGSVSTMVWIAAENDTLGDQIKELAEDENTVIAAFNLGWKLDSMMSLESMIDWKVGRDSKAEVMHIQIDPATASLWMQREAQRHRLRPEEIGVVVHAHGATFHWNETMRDAIEPLQDKYLVEFAFSMADRPSIESALARLQDRGARGAVVVRVFGREDSFRTPIEKMLGIDVEKLEPAVPAKHANHNGGGGHMAMGGGRIRTSLVVTSNGGLGDHPLFAKGLLARANEVSEDPANETLVIVAHGVGDDDVNDYWLELLDSLRSQIRELSAEKFRAIEVATWREDWPDKRAEWVERVRALVKAAQEDGGRAIVVPARTNSGGPEDELLDGLDYSLAEGFAPHPLFTRWIETQILDGVAALTGES